MMLGGYELKANITMYFEKKQKTEEECVKV